MTIQELRQRISADSRMKRLPIVIGERPSYDEAFNLVRQANGKWATFYGEHGFPSNKKEYDTEEEAADAFRAILEDAAAPIDWRIVREKIRAYRKEERRRKKQRRREWWRNLRARLKRRTKDDQ